MRYVKREKLTHISRTLTQETVQLWSVQVGIDEDVSI